MPYLFSYGTLQQQQVQRSTFDRLLVGSPDELVGYILTEVRVDSPSVVAISGKAMHPMARFTGIFSNRIPGTVFQVTEQELSQSDHYEIDAYQRVSTTLASGKVAWVYVAAAASSFTWGC